MILCQDTDKHLMKRNALAILFLAVFVDLVGYGMIVPLLPFYVQRVAPGATLVGILSGFYAMAQFLVGPMLGSLSDRFGRRPVLIACLSGTSLAYLLLAIADSLPLLVLALLIDGVTGGNLSIAQASIADSTTPDRRARGLGLIGAAFGLGLMVGPVIGGMLSLTNLSAPALVASALAFANTLFALAALPESLPPERRRLIPLDNAKPSHWSMVLRVANPLANLIVLLRIVAIRRVLMVVVLLNLAFSGLYSNFPLFTAARFGWGMFENALFFAFVGICAVTTQGLLLGRMQRWLGDARLARVGMIVMVCALLATGLASAAWMLYPSVGLIAFGSGLAIPALTSLLSLQVSPADQGRLMGGTAALLNLTMIAGPVVAGISFDRAGTAAPYLIGALLGSAALLIFASPTIIPRQEATS
jgi:MFS family permease